MAGLIAPTVLEQIRAANDIVEVIGSYFPLKRAGANFVALCPFHKEKTPSFNVNPHRQIFHCFGCHKGGDVFKFIQEYEGLPFVDAVRRLAERARIPLEFSEGSGQAESRHLKERLLEVHEQITRRWQGALQQEAAGEGARAYLARRGVSAEAIHHFRLGFAPPAWDDTLNWGKSKGYDAALLEKAGLVLRKDPNASPYDRFRGRLMFPIADEQGRVIGFSARLLEDDPKAAKYINSPETLIFQKGKVIFGLDKAKRALLDAERAIVCEGQLDLIACHSSGVLNVVAPQGTAFTAEHARILKRYVDEVILCFDADPAGQAAAVRALDPLLAAGLALRVAVLPAPHDPDTFIRELGAEAFSALIDRAQGFFDFYLDRICREHGPGTDLGRMAIVRAMAEAVLKTNDLVLLDIYSQKTAQRLGVSASAVRAEFAKRARSFRSPLHEDAAAGQPGSLVSPPSPAEFWLVRILFLHDELVSWVAEHLDVQWLVHPQVSLLVARRLQVHVQDRWLGLPAFLQEVEDAAAAQLLTEAVSDPRPVQDPERALKGDVARQGILQLLRNDYIARQLAALQAQTGRPDLSEEEVAHIERTKAQLRLLKRQPLHCGAGPASRPAGQLSA